MEIGDAARGAAGDAGFFVDGRDEGGAVVFFCDAAGYDSNNAFMPAWRRDKN